MPCKLCKERGKNWNGDNPICAFDGNFQNNWNCATLNAIRDICYEGQNPLPIGVDYQYCDDLKYATIKINEVDVNEENIGLALWVQWYKNRCKTEEMWILGNNAPPRLPKEKELEAIIRFYNKK